MNRFEIIFNANEIDHNLYPERTGSGKNSIIVDSDRRYIIPYAEDTVKIFIKGQLKTYTDVFAVAPYGYQY